MDRKSKTSLTSRRKFLAHGAGLGVALAAGARIRPAIAAPEKINFQLDWIAYGRHAPYYAALEKGFYRQRDLDVSIAQGRGTLQSIRTLVAGQSQFVFLDIGVMLSVRAKEGAAIKALACMYQRTPHTLFYMKNKGIVKPKDLEGKTIAFSPGDSPKLMFPAFAKANGIDEFEGEVAFRGPEFQERGAAERQRRRHGDLRLHPAGAAEGRQAGRRGRHLRLRGLGCGFLFQRPRCDGGLHQGEAGRHAQVRAGDDGGRGVHLGESERVGRYPEETSASTRRGDRAQGGRDPAQPHRLGVVEEAARQHDARDDGCDPGAHGQVSRPDKRVPLEDAFTDEFLAS